MEPQQARPVPSGERVFRLLVDTVEDYAMCGMDTEGHILSWNVGAARIYGYTAAEVIGQSIAIIFTEDDRRAGAPERELRNAAIQGRSEVERWYVRKDDSRLWALGLVIPLREADGTLIGFGKIIRDRTDRKELQDALRHHARELECANHDKTVFLATLAHELRNPINVLAQAAELLKRPSSVEPLRLSQMISRQVEHAKRLVDDLLDIARIGHNKLELQPAPLDLRNVITRAAEMAQPVAKERGVSLDLIVPETSVKIAGDGTRLVQVFSNLLNNAVKFSEAESSVTLALTCEAGEAVTRVTDRGSGIPQDQLASIFDLFSQAHVQGTTSAAGLGIGLALTRDLVLLHGGTIQACSEGVGMGSEFIVRLPLVGDAASMSAAIGSIASNL